MRIACSSLAFSQRPFEDACHRIARLGFRYVDVAVMQGWAHFDASDLVERFDEELERAQKALERAGLTPVALNASAGTSEVGPESERFAAICRFARALRAPVICYVAPLAVVGMERAVRRYERLRDIAQEHGVLLAVEAHARTMLEIPELAVEFCERLESVYLTLDPSHMYAGENQGAPYEILFPYVRHTHWRDAGTDWSQAQVNVGEGVVDFEYALRGLRAAGYEGAYSVEYIDTFPNGGVQNIQAMKTLLEELLVEIAQEEF
ncbi:MAG: hypothetical protein KatS3mg115_1420 [Candidatus Poribacteria bacterium]|nr:MAG: hypothetical protein KatS3mg115_1420 [Candidatus Poribacteria bacterium]